MRQIGRVAEIWRYPVSSLGGELLDTVAASPHGLAGDRRFGLFDRSSGRAAAPEQDPRWRPALQLVVTCGDDALPRIGFPGQGSLRLDDLSIEERLADMFGFPVGIAVHAEHPAATASTFPAMPNRYTPAPLHIVTTSSLSRLGEAADLGSVDRRRFRPSLLIETESEGFVENAWVGMTLRIGDLDVTVTEPTRRCGMTLVAQPGIDEEPQVLRAIMRHNARNLGVYAAPVTSGSIAVGDGVYAGT